MHIIKFAISKTQRSDHYRRIPSVLCNHHPLQEDLPNVSSIYWFASKEWHMEKWGENSSYSGEILKTWQHVPLKCVKKGTSPLWYSTPKTHSLSLTKRKHHLKIITNQMIFYKIPVLYTSKLSRSWKTRKDWDTIINQRILDRPGDYT